VALGNFSLASGNAAIAIGENTNASGLNSTALGYGSLASGIYSMAVGSGLFSKARGAIAVGGFNDVSDNPSGVIAASTDRIFQLGNGNGLTRSNALTILRNGNMGINNLIPSVPLSFENIVGNKIAFYSSGLNNQYGIGVQGNLLQLYADQINSDIAFGYGGSTAFTENMRIKGNGNVGIGNSVPNAPLQFSNSLVNRKIVLYEGANNDHQYYGFGVNGSTLRYQVDALSADHVFFAGNSPTGTTELMRIKGNGNVGIGTNNPVKPLSFPASTGEKILLYPGATGEVGIGVYANELRIHSDYAGAKISFGYQNNAGVFTQTMWLNNTTSVLTVGATAYASDIRFKKNIQPLLNPLEKINQLRGVAYEMRTDEFPTMNFSSQLQVGVIAQEVEKVMPSAVYEINEAGYKGVDYAKLVPLLIESIKALNKRSEDQAKEILELKKRFQ
jgi:hypothetical protein